MPVSRTESDVEAVREFGASSLIATLDVTDNDAVQATVQRIADELGGVDVLVNNAGINPPDVPGTPGDGELNPFDDAVDMNLGGARVHERHKRGT